jgi:predicted aldo/keto reductase-like oxidoreductase
MYEAMLSAKEQGLIKHIGITNHKLNIAREAVESGLYDVLQFPFSYLSSSEEESIANLCEEKDVGFVCMKAMSGGLITDYRPSYAYLNQFDNALPIWGIQRESELDQFIGCMTDPPVMNDELRKIIDNDRKELSGSFCRGCGYCLPCPAEINIPICSRMSLLLRRSRVETYVSEKFRAMMRNIENCMGCRVCTARCPYGLETPELLKINYNDYNDFITKYDLTSN